MYSPKLLHDLDSALKFSIEVEGKKKLEDVENYDEVIIPPRCV